jgi:hypothetical protein
MCVKTDPLAIRLIEPVAFGHDDSSEILQWQVIHVRQQIGVFGEFAELRPATPPTAISCYRAGCNDDRSVSVYRASAQAAGAREHESGSAST